MNGSNDNNSDIILSDVDTSRVDIGNKTLIHTKVINLVTPSITSMFISIINTRVETTMNDVDLRIGVFPIL